MRDLWKKIGLGTVQFGMKYGISNQFGQTSEKEVKKILSTFKIKGGSIIDTASAYGMSESVLGEVGVEEFKVVSKFMPQNVCGLSISDQLDKSFKKLQIKRLYGYLAHRTGDLIDDSDQWEELLQLKEDGLILKIGVSLTEINQWDKLLEKELIPDLIQVPYNYFDRRFEPIIKQFKKKGGEVHSRSTFLQGLFFREPDTLPDFFNEVKPVLTDLQREKKNLNGNLLTFTLTQSLIDTVITGVETVEQLNQNYNSVMKESDLEDFKITISEEILNPASWPKN